MQTESLIPQSSILGTSTPSKSISNRSIPNEGSKPKVLHSPPPNNGSENCDPNVVGSCHKRKLKPSSKSDASARNVSPSRNDHRTKPAASDLSFLSPPRKVVCNSRRFHPKNSENNGDTRPKSSLGSNRLAMLSDDVKSNKCCHKKDPLAPLQEPNGGNQCKKCLENNPQRRWSAEDKLQKTGPDSDAVEIVESAKSEDVTCYSSLKRASTDSVEEIQAGERRTRPKSPSQDKSETAINEEIKPASKVTESELQPSTDVASDPEKENGEVTSQPTEGADGTVTPERTGNWRLTAVLQEFGNLTPTREGRVKTLVRAFEKLMTTSENKEEPQNDLEALKPREFPLQFTYLGSVADGKPSKEDGVETEETELAEEEEEGDDEQSKQSGVDGQSSSQTVEESGESSGAESVRRFSGPSGQQPRVHKFSVGRFASNAQGKKTSNRTRKVQGSKTSVITVKKPAQKPQPQPVNVQGKPRQSKPNPFKLKTEERGHLKEQEFLARLRQMVEEEEKLRIPLAQGLPWTTDEPEVPPKPPVKEITRPVDVHLNSDLRAMERAEFDQYISEKLLYLEQRRQEEERLRKLAEEQEIKKLRQEMVPKAQLMPYFDRPFRPKRSTKRPTIPKEPKFHLNSNNEL